MKRVLFFLCAALCFLCGIGTITNGFNPEVNAPNFAWAWLIGAIFFFFLAGAQLAKIKKWE